MPLTNLELIASASGPEAAFDLSPLEAPPLLAALAYYRRTRYSYAALEADDCVRLVELTAVADNIDFVLATECSGVLRLSVSDAQTLAAAVKLYLLDRDVESYQTPEERTRIEFLRELEPELTQMSANLQAALTYTAANA